MAACAAVARIPAAPLRAEARDFRSCHVGPCSCSSVSHGGVSSSHREQRARFLRSELLGVQISPLVKAGRHGGMSTFRRMHVMAMDASIGGEESASGPPSVFPRIGVRDPYKRLGLGRDASTEEIQEAKNYLLAEHEGHERSREAIEDAYDKIISEKFRLRKKTKINLKADLKKRMAESPPWIQGIFNMVEVPKSAVIVQRLVLYVLLGVWSVMNPSEGGPAFQVAVALATSVYFMNDRLKSLGRAFLLGFGALVVGWVVGSLVVPLAPEAILPRFWSLELGTALVSYVFLWLATTFLK